MVSLERKEVYTIAMFLSADTAYALNVISLILSIIFMLDIGLRILAQG